MIKKFRLNTQQREGLARVADGLTVLGVATIISNLFDRIYLSKFELTAMVVSVIVMLGFSLYLRK